MRKNIFIPVLLAVLVMLMVSLVSVSAQEIDVNSMDNEQLTALLMQILYMLQQEEEPAADPAPEAGSQETPVPVIETDPEMMIFSVYDNKKLTVEALPAYMFIQPTKPPEPEPQPESGSKPKQDTEPEKGPEHYPGEICDYDSLACDNVGGVPVNCHPYRTWELIDGVWMCPAG